MPQKTHVTNGQTHAPPRPPPRKDPRSAFPFLKYPALEAGRVAGAEGRATILWHGGVGRGVHFSLRCAVTSIIGLCTGGGVGTRQTALFKEATKLMHH